MHHRISIGVELWSIEGDIDLHEKSRAVGEQGHKVSDLACLLCLMTVDEDMKHFNSPTQTEVSEFWLT